MEIVLAGQISGTRNGKAWPGPGTRLDLDDDEARGLLKSGMAFAPDDERVKHLGNGNGHEPFTDELIAGAPEGRDWTEGQADTNLARARMLELAEGERRDLARAAAERAGLTDAETVPGRDPSQPTVGDDQPNPTDLPSVVALPTEVDEDDVDDNARQIGWEAETASVDPDSGSENAADTTRAKSRSTTAKTTGKPGPASSSTSTK